ncbi:hypothetical protein EH223_13460 [candidate division KSB1 bacterium]|nr:hypothetical protein [candidate division KSB1 bacterium]RQW02056.1 MAG: hypothetical protein EH223_13460 [candidate division KSB1 bacterium]
MNSPLQTPEAYELYIYSLKEHHASIEHSTLTFVRRGASLAKVSGELVFIKNYKLVVLERLSYDRLPMKIDGYGYEVWHGEQKLYWYDSQPHPDEPELQSTHPHHKHIQPNIKHNRVIAPNMSFTKPNLKTLVQEIENLIESTETQSGVKP